MTQNSDANKSVITFYSIKKDLDIAKLSYKDVWKKYVFSKTEGVSCVNIFQFNQLKIDENKTFSKPKYFYMDKF